MLYIYVKSYVFQNDSLKEEVEYLKKELSTVQQKYDTMLTVNLLTCGIYK